MVSGSRGRTEFTDDDAVHMVQYLATNMPDGSKLSGNQIWQRLCENSDLSWPKRHTWQSWRNHYVKNDAYYDRLIRKYQKKRGIEVTRPPTSANSAQKTPSRRSRTDYTHVDDKNLARWLVQQNSKYALGGQRLWQDLVTNEQEISWASRHPWQSWRQRYLDYQDEFDRYISSKQHLTQSAEDHSTRSALIAEKRVDEPVPISNGEVMAVAREESQPSVAAPIQQNIAKRTGKSLEDQKVAVTRREAARVAPRKGNEESQQQNILPVRHNVRKQSPHPNVQPQKKRRRSADNADVLEEPAPKRQRVADTEHNRHSTAHPPIAPQQEAIMSTAEEGLPEETARPQSRHPSLASGNDAKGQTPVLTEVEPSVVAETQNDDVVETEEPQPPPPPSDDYTGDIFERGREESVDTDEQEDQLASDNGDMAVGTAEEIDVDNRRAVDDIADGANPEEIGQEASISSTVTDMDPTSQERLYPEVPLPIALPDHAFSISSAYIRTSTPNGPVPGQTDLAETDKLLAASVAEGTTTKFTQEPTPPTSVVLSPSQSPQIEHGQDNSPVPVQKTVEQIAKQSVNLVPNAEAGPSTSPSKPSSRKHPRLKQREEIDPFGSLSTTPAIDSSRKNTPPPPRRQRDPPRLEVGPFNSVFTDAWGSKSSGRKRMSGVNDSEDMDGDVAPAAPPEQSWPPQRHKGKGKEPEVVAPHRHHPFSQVELETQTRSQSQHHPYSQVESRDQVQARPKHHPFSQVESQTQAQTQPQHHAFSQISQENQSAALTQSQPQSQPQSQHHAFSQPSQHVPKHSRLVSAERGESSLVRLENRSVRSELTKPIGQPSTSKAYLAQSSNSCQVDLSAKPSGVHTRMRKDHSSSRDSMNRSVRFGDVPAAQRSKGKEKAHVVTPYPTDRANRRHTIASVAVEDSHSPYEEIGHIRLHPRHSLPFPLVKRDEPRAVDDSWVDTSVWKTRNNPLITKPPPRALSVEPMPLQLSNADQSMIVSLGVETAIQAMSDNHGFHPDVVRRAWNTTGSLKEADTLLRLMREGAERAAAEALQAAEGPIAQKEKVKEMFLPRGRSPTVSAARTRGQSHPRRSTHLRTSPVLHYTPAKSDEDSDVREYSPPKHSRAGQFMRLVKEGREQEALAREISRAGGMTPFQTPQKDLRASFETELNAEEDEVSSILGGEDLDVNKDFRSEDLRPEDLQEYEEKLGTDNVRVMLGKQLGRMLGVS